jgi:hypothetical protein
LVCATILCLRGLERDQEHLVRWLDERTNALGVGLNSECPGPDYKRDDQSEKYCAVMLQNTSRITRPLITLQARRSRPRFCGDSQACGCVSRCEGRARDGCQSTIRADTVSQNCVALMVCHVSESPSRVHRDGIRNCVRWKSQSWDGGQSAIGTDSIS